MRILPTLLAGAGLLTTLAAGRALAGPSPVPTTPTTAHAPVTAPAKSQAAVKSAPHIGMLLTDPKAVIRPQTHRSNTHSSSYATWLPNASDAIRRQ